MTEVASPNPPTCDELFNEDGIVSVQSTTTGVWRHGRLVEHVYRRFADDTFWRAGYRVSADGETYGLRDGNANIVQVEPYLETVTKFRAFGIGTLPSKSDAPILVSWSVDFGRMGDLDGLFITTQEQLAATYGKEAYFGEVLGKHSDVRCDLKADQFTIVSTDTAVIDALIAARGVNVSGYNPLDYICEEEPDDAAED